ncbi:unnamed protein product [Vicia faba]|uniref:RNase H type-1 domain-containing protein n=1 Tax=Vicia faba TaxID=3906 RepID=A0AAV1BAY9_VICFA|nr:unnamed protein product [Vicia faba]
MSVTKLQFQPFYFPHLFYFVGGYEIQFMVSEWFLNCFPKSSFLYCLGFSNFQSSPCSSAISDDKDVTCYCTLEFDGVSIGNPGKSGAGAVLRSGNEVQHFSRGLDTQTNNSTEY